MDNTLDFLPKTQKQQLKLFKNALQQGNASVLIGAGVSLRAGMPDGATLARQLLELSGVESDSTDLITVCDLVENELGKTALRRHLANLLDDETYPLSDAHQLLARIPFARYLTTNIDRLMEWALRDAGKRPSPVFMASDTLVFQLNRTPVIKLHGDIDHPKTLVFSSSDFAEFEKEKAHAQALLQQALSQQRLLVMGYRGTDPNFVKTLQYIQTFTDGADHLLIDFGREADRHQLRDLGCYLIDPGVGEYGRLPDILGYLADFDQTRINSFRERKKLLRANPFPGLSPYRIGAHQFRGREARAQKLFDDLPNLQPVTVFFGDSGVGKSSLFQAGLAPLLQKSANYCWSISQLKHNSMVSSQLLALIAEALGEPQKLDAFYLKDQLKQRQQVCILVLDQFERFFLPPFDQQKTRDFFQYELPALIESWGASLKMILIMRSDALYRMQPYRDHTGLQGVFHLSERIRSLTHSEAWHVVDATMQRCDYSLSEVCVKRLVEQAGQTSDGDVYLPYLQLLASRFYDWLEARFAEQRGYAQEITIEQDQFDEFLQAGDLFQRHVADCIIELRLLTPDGLMVQHLLQRLIEGDRRNLIRALDLEKDFIDPARTRLLLHELSNQRLSHFNELLGGYELVHDALIQPIRDYLDKQYRDFSQDEFLAIAKKVMLRQINPGMLNNLVNFCCNRGLEPAWLEEFIMPQQGWPQFYMDFTADYPEQDKRIIWQQLERLAQQGQALPEQLEVEQLLKTALISLDPNLVLAALTLLRHFDLSDKQLGALLKRLDYAHPLAQKDPAVHDPYQNLGWLTVFELCLDMLHKDPRIKITELFCEYNSVIISAQEWWLMYYQYLLKLHEQQQLTIAQTKERFILGLGWAEQEDPEQLIGMVQALVANPAIEGDFNDVVQRCITALGLRRNKSGFELILPLCERYLEQVYPFIRLRLLVHADDFARTNDRHKTAYLLGLSAQDNDGLLELYGRYFVAQNTETKATLLQAIADSPAQIDNIKALDVLLVEDDTWHQSLAYSAAQNQIPQTQANDLALLSSDTNLFAGLKVEQALLKAYQLGVFIEVEYTQEQAKLYLLKLLVQYCVYLAEQATRVLPEYQDDLLFADRTCDGNFIAWWDQASGILMDFHSKPLQQAAKVDGAVTWLKFCLQKNAEDLHGGLKLLHSRVQEWQARIQNLVQACQTGGSICYRPRISKQPVFEALCLLLEKADIQTGLDEHTKETKLAVSTLDALQDFAQAEQHAAIEHARGVAESLVVRLLTVMRGCKSPGDDSLLWGLLSRSTRMSLPGRTDDATEQEALQLLLEIYRGTEAMLAQSLEVQTLDEESKLKMYIWMAENNADAIASELHEQFILIVSEEPESPWVEPALQALKQCSPNSALAQDLDEVVKFTQGKIRDLVIEVLLHHQPSLENRLLALEAKLN